MLFIHGGFGGTSVALAPPIREAVDQVRLIEYDRRNCGRSEIRDEVYTQDDLGDDAAALLAYLGVDEAVIVGSSMGGTIAQTLALRHPGRIAALALVNTSAHMKDAPFYAPIAEMVELASRQGSDAVFERRRESIYNTQLPSVRHPGATEADRGEMHARVDAQFKVIRETPEEELKALRLGRAVQLARTPPPSIRVRTSAASPNIAFWSYTAIATASFRLSTESSWRRGSPAPSSSSCRAAITASSDGPRPAKHCAPGYIRGRMTKPDSPLRPLKSPRQPDSPGQRGSAHSATESVSRGVGSERASPLP